MLELTALLAVPGLDLRPVVDGEAAVRWVATSELEDPTPFLEGGEVLLTTGLNTRGWRAQWRPYVARLRRAGVAAIGLGTGLTHARPPAALVTACRAEAMPLFEVPRQTGFVSISRVAVSLLETAEQSLARRVVAAQHDLTSAAVGAEPEVDLLRALARLVGGTAAVFDPQGGIRLGPFGEATLDHERVTGEIAAIRPLGVRGASGFGDPATSTSVQPIGVRGQPRGYLVVVEQGRPDEADRVAAATALGLLSLLGERAHEEQARDRLLRQRAWALLAQGEEVAARAVLQVGGRALPDRLQIVVALGDAEVCLEIAERRRGLVLSSPVGEATGIAFSGRVPSALLVDLERAGCTVGVGLPVAPAEFARAETTAVGALRTAGPGAGVADWSEVAGHGVLGLVEAGAAAEFARGLIDPLDADQRLTLAAFLEHHGSRIATAETLGVHRNTVRNRIEAIEERWGRSLDDAATRVDAWVALQIPRPT